MRRRRRWGLIVLGILAVLILVPTGWMIYSYFSTQNAWDDAAAEAAQDLPRWRLLELEADRPQIPDHENSALQIIAAHSKGGRLQVGGAPNYDLIFEKLPPTTQLNTQQLELIHGELGKVGPGLPLARSLKDMPRGRFPIKYSDDGISTLLPNHQDARTVADWLKHDAYALAQDEKYEDAADSCRAILNAGRSMEGDLTLICHLIRIAMQMIATDALERVLAQGTLKEEALQSLQATLERDGKQDHWIAAIRGERALMNHLFENVRSGKVKMSALGGMGRGGAASLQDWLFDTFPSTMLKYYPEHLRYMNAAVEIARLPIHERGPKLQEQEAQLKNTNILTRLLAPALTKVHNAEARSQAMLRSAAVALACERYRQRHKDWPASLDGLVQVKLLDAVPLDPFDGQPLRYRRTKDGIVIYSVGPDKIDNQGHIDRERSHEPGVDVGFRLWNPGARRQEPRPAVGLPEVGGPE